MVVELIVIRGLPGSGKSTLARKIKEEHGFDHYEPDQHFYKDGLYTFKKEELGLAIDWCHREVAKSLGCGQSVVVTGVLSKLADIEDYRYIASMYGAQVTVLECTGDFGSIHNVPSEVIETMKAEFERLPEAA